ncbi:ABC transporter permease, partial [Rhodopseudomonas sp. BR0G17]|nr:ABC transporter permease [Rhodopseudomonas sp. BR0G17]
MSPLVIDRLIEGIIDTLLMIGASSLITLGIGLPLALLLVATSKGGILEQSWVNSSVGSVVNVVRSVPFLILMVALIPFTRLIVGTSYGVL